jgi:multidrug efflux pump subunit AcrB
VSLSAFALRYKTVLVVLVALLMLWGLLSYNTMPRRENPEFVIRVCLVQTNWPGTPAERVEELITAPLEAEINTLDGLRWVRSQTVVGRSSIFVELDRPTVEEDVAQMWDQVRARVDRVAMPEPGIKPVVFDDFGDEAIMLLTLYQTPMPGQTEIREQDRYSFRDLEIFAERLQDELRIVDGIAKVDIAGVRREAIYVESDLATWSQLGLTTEQLGGLLEARNVLAPGGTIDTDQGRFSVKPSGDIDAVRELDAVVVGLTGEGATKTPVYIDNLGLNVVRGYEDPPAQIARHAEPGYAAPCVEVSMTMKDGSNVIATSALVKKRIRELREVTKIFPPDIAITPIIDAAETVDAKLKDFVGNVVGAIVIVIAVAYLIVGFRSSSVMAANIPIVIVGSLALITLFGVQLEQISLAAMIIALGMLVDNAVQICDQCRRLQSEGLPRFKAAVEGANQLSFPMFIATMTTVMAFFPMLLGLQGAQKEYVQSLPITISVVLLLSWVMAMTFCVLLAYWLIRAPKDPEASLSPVVQALGWLRRGKPKRKKEGPSLYYRLSLATLKGRWLVVVVSAGALVGTSMLPVASEFFPKDERDAFAVEVWLPEGATIEQTDAATKRVEELVMKLSPGKDQQGQAVERLRAMRTMVGGGGGRWYLSRDPEALKPNYAELLIRTSDGAFTPGYAAAVRRIAREGDEALGIAPIAGVRVIPRELIMGPGVPAPVAIRIFAPRLGAGFADPHVLKGEAAKVKDILHRQEGVWDIYDTWGSPAYQLDVEIDPDKANLAGVRRLRRDRLLLRRGPLGQGAARLRRGHAPGVEAGHDRAPLPAAPDRGARPQRGRLHVEQHRPGRHRVARVQGVGSQPAAGLLVGGRRRPVRVEAVPGGPADLAAHLAALDHPAARHPVQRRREAADHHRDASAGADRRVARPLPDGQRDGFHAAARPALALRGRCERGDHLPRVRRPDDRGEGQGKRRERPDHGAHGSRVPRLPGPRRRGAAAADRDDDPDDDRRSPAARARGRPALGGNGLADDLRTHHRHRADARCRPGAVRDLRGELQDQAGRDRAGVSSGGQWLLALGCAEAKPPIQWPLLAWLPEWTRNATSGCGACSTRSATSPRRSGRPFSPPSRTRRSATMSPACSASRRSTRARSSRGSAPPRSRSRRRSTGIASVRRSAAAGWASFSRRSMRTTGRWPSRSCPPRPGRRRDPARASSARRARAR